MIKLDRVEATPLRHGTQFGAVVEALGKGHKRPNNRSVAFLLHPLHTPAPRVKVTHNIAHILFGHRYFGKVDRF